ncbi:MAG: helix-turn-helix domain-containing protein [Anaerolineae bacterium]|nr:helix-turn-helix domain-containing protein [Anaerolineae bacterium]
MNYHQHVPAAERTLKILELLSATPEGLRLGDIQAALDIPRSALFALLNTLKMMGYITQSEVRQPYCPGPRLQALAQPQIPGVNTLISAFYEEAIHPTETLALAILSGSDVLILAEAPCVHTVRSVFSPGQRVSAVHHPAGHVILAGWPEPTLTHRIGKEDKDFITNLRQAREHTFIRQTEEDTVTLAVPICPNGQRPEAALICSTPSFRWNPPLGQEHLQMSREMAARLSYRLGALTYQPYGHIHQHLLKPSVPMSSQELQSFLAGPWAARLACVRPDGSPHVVPVWYEWRDNVFIVAAWPGSVWADFVIQNPSVALTIDEPWPPMRRVLVRGIAQTFSPTSLPENIEKLYQRLSARYLGTAAQHANYHHGWRAFHIHASQIIARREQKEAEA